MSRDPLLGIAVSIPLSILAGAATWLLSFALTGETDGQGHGIYWTTVYPAMAVSAFALGAMFRRPLWLFWICSPCIMVTHLVLILNDTEADLNMLPIGLVIQFLLTLPFIAAGLLGWVVGERISGLRKRLRSSASQEEPRS
jgi:hypothetical protein